MKPLIALFCLLTPTVLVAEPTVLIDAIPSAAAFAGITPLRMPFKDAETADPKGIEQGLNGAMASFLPAAAQQGFDYICLLSAPGEQPVEIPIAAAKASLKLSRTNTAVYVAFYKGGHPATVPVTYAVGAPTDKKGTVNTSIRLMALPPGGSVAGWVYLNLPRIQAEAEKGATHGVHLETSGEGDAMPVPIPGLKEPLLVHEKNVTLTATWSMDPKMDATHKGEVLGHAVPASAH